MSSDIDTARARNMPYTARGIGPSFIARARLDEPLLLA